MGLGRRLLIALPDGAAAALYLWCWIAPVAWHQELVAFLVLVLLIEFVAMHASPFLGSIIYGGRMGFDRKRRLRIAIVLGATYLAFAGLAAASFDAWFPFFVLLWLFGARLFSALVGFDRNAEGRAPEMSIWAFSVGYYFGAVFLTFFAPVPMLGITEDGAVYGLRGQFEWANFPYKPIAAGFLYFLALALTRLFSRGFSAELSATEVPVDPSDDSSA